MVLSKEGTFMGEIAALLKIPRTATLKTLEKTDVIRLARPIEGALRSDPRILRRLLQALEARLRHLEDLLVEYETSIYWRTVERLTYLALTHGGTDLSRAGRIDRMTIRVRAEEALEKNAGVPDPAVLAPVAKAAGVGGQFAAALRDEFGAFRPFGRRPAVASLDPVRTSGADEGIRDVRDLAGRIVEGNGLLSGYMADPTHERNREAAAADLEALFEPSTLRSILLGVFLRWGLKGGSLASMREDRLHFEGEIDRAEEDVERRRRDAARATVAEEGRPPSPFRTLAARHGLEERYLEALRAAGGASR
jgi:hypothetical protein